MIIRHPVQSDLPNLLALENDSCDNHMRGSKSKLLYFLTRFNEYQYIIEDGNAIVGYLCAQTISSTSSLLESKFSEQCFISDAQGEIVHLCSIAVGSNIRGNTGSVLRDNALNMAKLNPRIKAVVTMTRCSNFMPSSSMSSEDDQYKEYEKYVHSGVDPTIFFHLTGGAKIIQICRDYRPEDVGNLGHGVLMQYDVEDVGSFAFIKHIWLIIFTSG